ncbi:DUF5954 family protein [Streptomyces sp. DSM 44917]|uniref:DUF5954 family protein n=1 Tax=Streptomyces boetiae TaxID=3075541 RepID=A0ABU2LAJ2_9ACTN|nr:DUF5954 family protein [Streptomyces sp. DSM 44917]MDT0308590.1 DUF5954 family protein [Streptomyces sp. DSM 44917]
MKDHRKSPPRHLTFRVTHRDDPVSEVTEQDTIRAAERYPHIIVRGPVFGFAEQRPEDAPAWRLLNDVTDGFPQMARDGLNSHLWFRAKEETRPGDPLREQLLAAVALLETEPADELRVGETRYRIVRGDEFARIGPEGLEGPRPTDPDEPGLDLAARGPLRRTVSRTQGLLVDHAAPTGVMESIQRMELLSLHYEAERIPSRIRADSRRALSTHPGVVLLPAAFTFAERKQKSWEPMAGLQPSPYEARATLYNYLAEFLPKLEQGVADEDAAAYTRAAEEFRAARPARDGVQVLGRRFQIIRVERLMRIGPDGPEPPRPTDEDPYGPMQIHPPLAEAEEGERAERAKKAARAGRSPEGAGEDAPQGEREEERCRETAGEARPGEGA